MTWLVIYYSTKCFYFDLGGCEVKIKSRLTVLQCKVVLMCLKSGNDMSRTGKRLFIIEKKPFSRIPYNKTYNFTSFSLLHAYKKEAKEEKLDWQLVENDIWKKYRPRKTNLTVTVKDNEWKQLWLPALIRQGLSTIHPVLHGRTWSETWMLYMFWINGN